MKTFIDGVDEATIPGLHKGHHEDGGSDEIDVASLSGELADEQKSNWLKISAKPSSIPADIDNAVDKKHSQNTDSALRTDKLIVDEDGKVGIGTAEPKGKLHVQESIFTDLPVMERTGAALNVPYSVFNLLATKTSAMNTGFGSAFLFQGDDTSDDIQNFAFMGGERDPDGGGAYVVHTYTEGTAHAEHLRVTRNGNVGIGTTEPKSKLHVTNLPEYADNAAAVTGGLTAGALYRTGDLLKVVH